MTVREQWGLAWQLARVIEQGEHTWECDEDIRTGMSSRCECGLGDDWEAALLIPLFVDAHNALHLRYHAESRADPIELLRDLLVAKRDGGWEVPF